MHGPLDRYKNPFYGFIFLALIAFLSSNFGSWGMEGITFAVLIAGGTVVAVPIGLGYAKKQWIAMLHGKHTRMDFLAAPSGYRRNRQTETPEEAARKSIVKPTPYRPLLPGDTIEGTVTKKPARKQLPPTPTWERGGVPTLYLAPDLNIPINLFIGRAIAGFGIRGSGKTSLAARIIEQLARFPIPMLVGDYEEDYTSLPDLLERCVIAGCPGWSNAHNFEGYYWEVDIENATQTGHYLLEIGYQVVLELRSYPTKEEAAIVFASIIGGLFEWADEHPEGRVPCLVFLDEAQHFLPENGSVSSIAKEASSALIEAFDNLNARGRKRGLTPCLFTQRIAQIKKGVIAGSEIWFLGKQQLPNDLERYEEIIGKDEQGKQLVNRRVIQTLDAGTFYLFEDGEFYPTTFWQRDTEHRGTTPSFQDALDRYGDTEVSRERPMTTSTEHLEDDQDTEVELEDDDDPLNDVGTRAGQSASKSAEPVLKDAGPKADDIPLDILIYAWNNGHNSDGKLMKAFGFKNNQAQRARKRIEEAAKRQKNEALA